MGETKSIKCPGKNIRLTTVAAEAVYDSFSTVGDFRYFLWITENFESITRNDIIIAEHTACIMTAV